MKKHSIIALSTILVLAACQPNSSQSGQEKTEAASAVSAALNNPDLMAGEFAQIGKLTQALKQKLTQATPEQADQLYQTHRQEMQTTLAQLNTQYGAFLENYDDEKNWQNVASEPRVAVGEMKQRLADLAAVQLRVEDTGMGVMSISENPDYYQKLFAGKTSPDVAAYIQLQTEDAQPLPDLEDVPAGWQALSKRVAAWENFMQKFPNSQYHAEAKEKFNQYADVFLFGNEHVPVGVSDEPALADTNAEYAKIEQTWTDYANQHPNSNLTPLFPEAKKIATMQDKQGEKRYLATQNFRKVHFNLPKNQNEQNP